MSDKSVKVESFPGAETCYMAMNMSEEHFKNPKVRQAMKLLVDYDGMVATLSRAAARCSRPSGRRGSYAAISLQSRGSSTSPRPRALLAEAGYPNGFEISLNVPTQPPMPDIAQAVQQTMAQAGIKAEPGDLRS